MDTPAGFTAIHEPGVNLVLWPRGIRDGWQPLLRRLLRERIHVVATLAPADVEWLILTEFARLGETDADAIELVNDIHHLARSFAALSGASNLTLRLEVVEADEHRLFHVDRRRLRMLCTYAGPGMQWLRNAQVDRAALGHGRNDGIVIEGSAHELAPGNVAVLKGELYPGNTGNGLVHRSPPTQSAGTPRLRLRFDQPDP